MNIFYLSIISLILAVVQADVYSIPLVSRASTIAKRDIGHSMLTNVEHHLWYAEIEVGSPANTFTVDIDTGSSDLFLPGVQCGSSCDGHKRYDPAQSSTSKDLGK